MVGLDSGWENSLILKILLLIFTIGMLIFEFCQMFYGGIYEYFSDLRQVVDFVGEIFILVYMSYKIGRIRG